MNVTVEERKQEYDAFKYNVSKTWQQINDPRTYLPREFQNVLPSY